MATNEKATLRKLSKRWMILLQAVMLAFWAPAAGRCCSLGGGASYDYLGDPAMSTEMESSDEFLRDNVAQGSPAIAPDASLTETGPGRLRLNLSDNASIELMASQAGESIIVGRGDLTRNNGPRPWRRRERGRRAAYSSMPLLWMERSTASTWKEEAAPSGVTSV